jgi:hypothetical protein
MQPTHQPVIKFACANLSPVWRAADAWRYASTAFTGPFMKQAVALVAIASILFLVACATRSPATARSDQFPMARAPYAVKAIAILPGAGVLAEAIGAELARRGFNISSAAATMNIVTGVDWKAVSELYVPGREKPGEVEKLMNQLHARGIDAFLVLKEDGFTPRQWRQYAYWQIADTHMYSTHPDLRGKSHSYWGWVNTDNDRAKSPSAAAAEIVTRMATFTSNPL